MTLNPTDVACLRIAQTAGLTKCEVGKTKVSMYIYNNNFKKKCLCVG